MDILYDNRHLKKTNLQMRLGLNYPRFIEYLQWMISHGLVQQQNYEDGTEIYLSLRKATTHIGDWYPGSERR